MKSQKQLNRKKEMKTKIFRTQAMSLSDTVSINQSQNLVDIRVR